MLTRAAITRLCLVLWLFAGLASFRVQAANPMVAAGGFHTVGLKNDGTLVAWGSDSEGQLGLGRTIRSASPIHVSGFGNVIAISAGYNHTVALKQDGTVWAWGWNEHYQLGDGTNVDRSAPVQAKGLTGITAIAAGDYYTLALKQDGTVWVWGYNDVGQLTYTYIRTPRQVQGLSGIIAIAAGRASLALKQDGTVWAWGDNTNGQVGNGTIGNQQTTPAPVVGLTGVSAIAASSGADQSLALKSDGTVWSWGWNRYGQLGDGSTVDRGIPVQVLGLTAVAGIATSDRSAFALKQDGSLWAWGWNYYGQLGDGTATDRSAPVPITAQTGIAGVSVGGNAYGIYALALKLDGTLARWGYSTSDLSGLTGVSAIGVGGNHSVALKQDGTVWTWGENDHGQLGDGAVVVHTVPAAVPGITGVAAVAAGWDHTLALKEDGTVWAWGGNLNGQLGDGTNSTRSSATRVAGLNNVIAVSAGFGSSLALKNDGTVWGWGSVGDGSRQWTPGQISGLSGITALASGMNHSLALKQDATVWAWGDNYWGQLGDGSTTSRGTPAQVSGLTGVRAIAAGGDNSLALKQDGTVWAWGNNAIGQIGDGTSINRSSPVQVQGLSAVIAVAAGGADSHALKQDGSLWAWGENWSGKLGDGTAINRRLPVQTLGLTAASAIAAGDEHVVALKQDGSVWVWGDNGSGQLGDGTFAQHRSPVLAVNETADGFLNLIPGTTFQVPPAVGVPFFVVSSGGITSTSASVSTTTKFNAVDVGKSGAVFVTGRVPEGTLVAAQSRMTARSVSRLIASDGSTSTAFVLVQLTESGWQPVVNGQLIPYASGVLGEQLSAQTILSGTDTTNLKGAEFCVGYGASAAEMIAAGTMRRVASIPDPNATVTDATSCMVVDSASATTSTTTTTEAATTTTTTTVAATTTTTVSSAATTTTTASTTTTTISVTLPSISIAAGWNLVGNGNDAALDVVTAFADASNVTTVWKWVSLGSKWAFFAPSLIGQALADYATGKGYDVLTTIGGGEGFWVNAKQSFSISLPSGNALPATNFSSKLVSGWNLVSIGESKTPSQFNAALGFNITTLWAWDNPSSRWFFYAASLEAQGSTALTDYIAGKGYLDFGANNKTLGNGTGFWVNR